MSVIETPVVVKQTQAHRPLVHWACDLVTPIRTLCGATTTPERHVDDPSVWPDCVVCESLASSRSFCVRGTPVCDCLEASP